MNSEANEKNSLSPNHSKAWKGMDCMQISSDDFWVWMKNIFKMVVYMIFNHYHKERNNIMLC